MVFLLPFAPKNNIMTKLSFLIIAILFLQSCTKSTYLKHEGCIFGTIYHISYESPDGKSIEPGIVDELNKVNHSLSTFDKTSVISRINQDDSTVIADEYFTKCFNKAVSVSDLSNGAFDMTVAPIVNAWGFGFDKSVQADSTLIDSLMQYVGYKKIKLVDQKIVKEIPGIMLDASAIAKGYGVDIASEYIEKQGIENYMVEIGGEVRSKGVNSNGVLWRIGIDKPIESSTLTDRELQDIIDLNNKSLATSGNYRQFYIKDGVKYAHTINPHTGYPALSNLLSSTVLADDCMTADALATAFMVLGVDKSIELAKTLDNIEVYFIYSDSTNQYQTYATPAFKKLLEKK